MLEPAQISEVADRFFEASRQGRWDDAVALVAPGAVVWQNVQGVETRFEDAVPGMRKLAAAMGPWRYENVRRLIGENGFCEQHLVRFAGGKRGPVDIDVCAVVTVDENGLITRIEEYFDSASA